MFICEFSQGFAIRKLCRDCLPDSLQNVVVSFLRVAGGADSPHVLYVAVRDIFAF